MAQVDTVFWFAAPNVSTSLGDNPIYLRFLTHDTPSTVIVSQPANGGFTPIVLSIPANEVDSIDLSSFITDIESPAANLASNNGLKITSTSAINAYYEVRSNGNREVFSLKGTKGIGENFYTPFQKSWNSGATTPSSFSSIDIVATEDNTSVLITPRANVVGGNANTTYSVVLNEGQTYSARDTDGLASTSLSGSIVASNKPVAVTVHEGGISNNGCLSTLGDQITTTSFAGNRFVIRKSTVTDEKVYILATQNATNITITNSSASSTLINWSETYEYTLTEDVNYISTSKPVYVLHVSGNGCSMGMAQVPNLFCAGTYNSYFTRSASDSLGVILYTRTGFESMFDLNGNTTIIDASDFQTVPGTNGEFQVGVFYFNTTDVPVNSYNVITNSGDVFGMGIISGSSGNGSSYAYHSEFNSFPFVDAGLDDTICANADLPLSGFVGGGSVTGTWSGTGFGSFQNAITDLNNVYIPSPLDTIISPIKLILTSTGPCPVRRDTIVLEVTPAPIVNANANQTVCANNANVNLNGNISGGASKGKWSTLGSGVFLPNDSTLNAVYVPSPADTVAGMISLVLTSTDAGECANESDTMTVTITFAPIVDAGADTISVCKNNNVVSLSGTVSGSSSTGRWVTSGNGIFSPNNLDLNATYQPSIQDINANQIFIILESTNNGNCSKAIDSILIQFTDAPVVDAGANITACTNVPFVDLSGLVSGPTSTGIWSGGTGIYDVSDTDLNAQYTPSATEISNGSLILTLTSTNNVGCNAVNDNVQISFVAPPLANFNANNVCLEETTSFVDFSLPGFGAISTWEWDFDNGMTSSNQSNNNVDYTTAGIYNVSLIVTTNLGCSDTIVKPVQVYELPNADFDYALNCTGTQLIIDFTDASNVSSDVINNWFYDFGGQGSQATQNPSQLFVGSGNFVITQVVTTVNGCIDSIVQIVNVPPRPDAGFFYSTSNGLNIGATFEFIDTSYNSVDYFWELGDGTTSSVQNPVNVYFENGIYPITQYVTNSIGCSDSATILISINTVTTEIQTLIPNAISPNGDGKNDVWKLEFINLLYPDATVAIFNRWGQEVFYSTGYEFPWNGTYKGERVSDGTYFYVIDLKDGISEPFRGSLLVLKNNDD